MSTGGVLLVALIAAVISFRHMHELALVPIERALAAALIPLSVDGTVVSSSVACCWRASTADVGGILP
jgi:hypothetical protein